MVRASVARKLRTYAFYLLQALSPFCAVFPSYDSCVHHFSREEIQAVYSTNNLALAPCLMRTYCVSDRLGSNLNLIWVIPVLLMASKPSWLNPLESLVLLLANSSIVATAEA